MDFAKQQYVQLHFNLSKVLGGYDLTGNYRVQQVEMRKSTEFAKVPAIDSNAIALQWPLLSPGTNKVIPNLFSVVEQLPLHEKAIRHLPIVDVRTMPESTLTV